MLFLLTHDLFFVTAASALNYRVHTSRVGRINKEQSKDEIRKEAVEKGRREHGGKDKLKKEKKKKRKRGAVPELCSGV